MRVVALTSGRKTPAARIRVRQYVSALAKRGITVEEHAPVPAKYTGVPWWLPVPVWNQVLLAGRRAGLRAAKNADVVWLEREFVSGFRTREDMAGARGRRVFDVDDAIWLNAEVERDFDKRIVENCAGVIAGNGFLAERYRDVAKRTWIVPTSVDTTRWLPPARRPEDRRFTIGWFGTSGNLSYVDSIEPALAAFFAKNAEARLLIVSDRAPRFLRLRASQVEYVRWSEEHEVDLVHRMDVGLMPLPNDEWSRGKCAAKMLQYMSTELPVVVSPIGVNAEVLAKGDVGFAATTTDEWIDALGRLHADRSLAARLGKRGRAIVIADYSLEASAERLADVFHSVAADGH